MTDKMREQFNARKALEEEKKLEETMHRNIENKLQAGYQDKVTAIQLKLDTLLNKTNSEYKIFLLGIRKKVILDALFEHSKNVGLWNDRNIKEIALSLDLDPDEILASTNRIKNFQDALNKKDAVDTINMEKILKINMIVAALFEHSKTAGWNDENIRKIAESLDIDPKKILLSQNRVENFRKELNEKQSIDPTKVNNLLNIKNHPFLNAFYKCKS